MEKMTITERINGINFETLTEEDFNFLVERALKSVRKSNGERKPTKRQLDNDVLKYQMIEALGNGMTATEVGKAVDVSVQRASALLKQMVDAGEVIRVKDGKTLLFKAVEAEEEAEGE